LLVSDERKFNLLDHFEKGHWEGFWKIEWFLQF
jgi:hypothetical protein